MRIKLLLLALTCFQYLWAQNQNKITGPLGVYHIAAGYSLTDSTGTDSAIMQYQFRFGDMAMPDQAVDNRFEFVPEIDSCISWNANRVVGIIQPPHEGGVYNQPSDTALYAPYPQSNGPGMIQGGQRFSRLSQLYGGFCGVILDDWTGDTSITRQVRDAVQGKYVDANGNVHSECTATTPNNKLYGVVYSTDANPAALSCIDGVQYYNLPNQNCCYANFDNDVTTLRANYPNKEIQIGIYLKNSGPGWLQPDGIHYILSHALNRYDDGDINGITLFAGVFLIADSIPLSIWNGFALPHWLDSLYYPYLGAGRGKLYDCTMGNLLNDAFVRVYCKGRISGDTLFRSRQKTDVNGQYHFGLWAGNRFTDSTYYWLVAEKEGYVSDTVGFWVKRGDTAVIPSLSLCPAPKIPLEKGVQLYPNPTSGTFIVHAENGEQIGGTIEVYNLFGELVYTATQLHHHTQINLGGHVNGIYVVVVRTGNNTFSSKHLLVLQR